MKLNSLLITACALALGVSAQAQTAVIELTGATAFRAGALDVIKKGFDDSGVAYKLAHDGGTFNASTRAIMRGNFKASDGTVLTDIVIRTAFNGSTEGMRALDVADYTPTTGALDEAYFTVASLSTVTAGTPATSFAGATEKAPADMSFSDVKVESVPTIDGSDFAGADLGAVTFTMLTNDGNTLAPFGGLTNVTAQQFRALMTNGRLPLSFFTGIPADGTSFVYASGRNDGSGTRTVYLAETGFGPSNLVRQFQARNTTSNGAGGAGTTGSGVIDVLQLVPAAVPSFETDANPGPTPPNQNQTFNSNISTVYGNPVVNGNGGYASGSVLRRIFGYSSKNTQVINAAGAQIAAAAPIALVTFLATADAITSIGQGARKLDYNGVGITPAAPLSGADKLKVTRGLYTAWSTEQLYGKDLNPADEQFVFDTIVANIGPVIETNGTGIRQADMTVSRFGGADGGTVLP